MDSSCQLVDQVRLCLASRAALSYDLILISCVVALQVKMSLKDTIFLVNIQGNIGHCVVVKLVVFAATCMQRLGAGCTQSLTSTVHDGHTDRFL